MGNHYITSTSTVVASIARALCGVLLGIAASATDTLATTYFVSPSGNDSNSGNDLSSPWKSFDLAVANLRPGDTLTLLDGTYTATTSGYLKLSNLQGTAVQPITIKALNERKAWLKGDGSSYVVYVLKSAYIVLEGLRVSSADLPGQSNFVNVRVESSNNITVRRFLVSHNNRYSNTALIQFLFTTYSLAEENELYFYQRHGLTFSTSDYNVARRNYCNSRGYSDIEGGFTSGGPGGDTCVSFYPGNNNIVENNISEGSFIGYDIEALGSAMNNRYLGNIAMGGSYGYLFKARGSTITFQPQNTTVTNGVVITPSSVAFYGRGNLNTRCDNCTLYNSSTNSGFLMDAEAAYPGGRTYSAYSENLLSINHTRGSAIYMAAGSTWIHDHPNTFGSLLNYNPSSSPNYITGKSVDPQLGSCRVWIPDGSPMKKAGKNGTDIGANVLYRYQNGSLTNMPLWDPMTGEFPHGATVSGLNDLPGQSAFDVHKRLNVNTNGCSFPAGYGKNADSTPPQPPQNVAVR